LRNTPLHCACSFGSIEVVEALLDRGANIFAENDAKFTPLHIAGAQGHEEVTFVCRKALRLSWVATFFVVKSCKIQSGEL